MEILRSFLGLTPSYLKTVELRLAVSGLGEVNKDTLKLLLELGVVLHDVGKAYEYYQSGLEKGIGFENHEILSAVSCYKTWFYTLSKDDRRLGTLFIMAVLNHHQSFRESMSKLTMSNRLRQETLRIAKRGLCGEVDRLNPVLKELNLTVEDIFPGDYNHFKQLFQELQGLLDFSLRQRFEENRRWLKLYSLIMFPIILADNLDASSKRPGSFSKTIIEELQRVMDDAY